MGGGRRYPTKEDHGREFFNLGDYPTGAPVGPVDLIFLDSGLKPIPQAKPATIRIGGTEPEPDPEPEHEAEGYETVEEALDRDDERPVTTENDFLTEYNRLNLRRKRIRNIREAKLASRLDAQMETVFGLITDSTQRINDLDQVQKVHLELQTGLTKRLAQEVIKAAPPPPPPDWAGALERGLGHIASVIMAAIGAKSEKDAAPNLKRLEKRVARLQKSISRGLPAPQRPDESHAAPKPAQVEPPSVPASSVIKPPQSSTESVAPPRDDSDDPPSAPKVAATETAPKASTTESETSPTESVTSPTKPDEAPAKRTAARQAKPYTVAWNRIKRAVASLTDSEITMFVANPQLGLSFLACLAELCPGGALATC